MTRISLNKLASDFSFENFDADAITQAEKSIATFKSAGGVAADLQVWNQAVATNLQLVKMQSQLKLPSEMQAAQKISEAAASNTSSLAPTLAEIETGK